MKFIPLFDRVMIHELTGQRQIEGVILPDATLQPGERAGIVIAVGEGYVSDLTGEIRPLRVKPGDKVLFGPWSGREIQIGDEPFMVMREQEITGIIPPS